MTLLQTSFDESIDILDPDLEDGFGNLGEEQLQVAEIVDGCGRVGILAPQPVLESANFW